jgi:KDO2-lipid IV(A) lauroyltransferase
MRLFFYLLSPFNLRLGYVFCDFIALVVLAINTEIVKISKININIAYSSKNKEYRESLVKRSVKQSIRSYYETIFCLSRRQKKLNKSIFKVENRFLYSQTNRDYGLIFLSAHNRSVDLLLNQLTNLENITAIFKPIKIKALNEFVRKNRQKSGSNVYETNFTGVKELFSALKRGETVAMAADQVPAKNMGVFENFFGRKVYTTNLIPSLHSKTKAPIVSVAIHSDTLTNKLYIRYGSKSNYKEKSQYNAKTMNKEIENIININPEDYNWEYKRFKKQEIEDKIIYK